MGMEHIIYAEQATEWRVVCVIGPLCPGSTPAHDSVCLRMGSRAERTADHNTAAQLSVNGDRGWFIEAGVAGLTGGGPGGIC